MTASPMVLMAGLYLDPDANRRSEFLECVRRNSENHSIERILLFIENNVNLQTLLASHPQLQSPKVTLVPHGRRLTYDAFFTYANSHLPNRRVVIANADIFFDQTLARLEGYDLAGKLLCLSRWDVDASGHSRFFNHEMSQDAWIFETPLRQIACGFHMGVPGCDNRLAWEAAQAGLCVLNPSLSIRAHHLHLTRVRHYSERQRVPGPGLSIKAGFLGTQWLWFVIPCMGRLNDLRHTISSTTAQRSSSCVVVDFSCPDGTGEWIGKHHPEVSLAKCEKRKYFRGAEARNLGATAIPEDGLICFLDADVVAGPEFSSHVLSRFTPGSFFVPDRDGPGLRTALVCSKGDFDKAGGFDEGFIDWGEEVTDLRASLCRIGLKEQTFPASLLSHQPQHRQAPSYSTISDRRKALEIHAAYRRVKSAATSACPDLCSLQTAMNEFDNALQAEKLATGATPCAAIAFHENMGYTIARLEAGATSHNNVERPFAAVPRALEGHRYTQVVAYSASPVEVKFLSAGKLYVLVGTDWDGHSVATAWLRSVGQREMMPPLLTRRQTGFEVWSLTGETGDRHVLPTQVMLVANSLDKV